MPLPVFHTLCLTFLFRDETGIVSFNRGSVPVLIVVHVEMVDHWEHIKTYKEKGRNVYSLSPCHFDNMLHIWCFDV